MLFYSANNSVLFPNTRLQTFYEKRVIYEEYLFSRLRSLHALSVLSSLPVRQFVPQSATFKDTENRVNMSLEIKSWQC